MKFNTTPLENSRIYLPFQIDTKWVVFTGAPSSGKSTTLEALSKRLDDFKYKKEIARSYFEKLLMNSSYSRNIENEANDQKEITAQKYALEESLNHNKQIFLDRGMPDSITYYRTCGLDPCEPLPHSTKFKYNKVFIFESLPPKNDGIRVEDEKLSILIRKWLEKDYIYLGYNVIKVAVDTLDNRVDFILSQLTK